MLYHIKWKIIVLNLVVVGEYIMIVYNVKDVWRFIVDDGQKIILLNIYSRIKQKNF